MNNTKPVWTTQYEDLSGATKDACDRLLKTLGLSSNCDLGTILSLADTRIRRLHSENIRLNGRISVLNWQGMGH